MNIAGYSLSVPLALAPMAGITDKPFRLLCRHFGAAWTVGEMISGSPTVRHTRKTLNRIDIAGEPEPIVMQIAGNNPQQMAESAAHHAALGAHVIDINMGCPAKKVCRREAGSALMRDEGLVAEILAAVVQAASVPVTLKTRLGWDDAHLNVLNIARIAQDEGIAALAIHGRSRTQMYRGKADYQLIGEVKKNVDMPIWVNGDIDSPAKAEQVLKETQADGVMVGRAAYGQPWLFGALSACLQGKPYTPLSWAEKGQWVLYHLNQLYDFYGENHGVRIARKHIGRYFSKHPQGKAFCQKVNQIHLAQEQYHAVKAFWQQGLP